MIKIEKIVNINFHEVTLACDDKQSETHIITLLSYRQLRNINKFYTLNNLFGQLRRHMRYTE